MIILQVKLYRGKINLFTYLWTPIKQKLWFDILHFLHNSLWFPPFILGIKYFTPNSKYRREAGKEVTCNEIQIYEESKDTNVLEFTK